MMKRIMSFVLALLMVVSMVPQAAVSAQTEDYSANIEGTAVFNPEWNTAEGDTVVYGVAYITDDPALGLNMSVDYTVSLESLMEQTFRINNYYSDGTGYWYELAALEGETLPEELEEKPWVYQNDLPGGAYPDYLIVTPPQPQPTEPSETTEPSQPQEQEPGLSDPETGVVVTADGLPAGVTLSVQETDAAAQLELFRIPAKKQVFALDISLIGADSAIYQPDGAWVKVPVSAAPGSRVGLIHDHNGTVTFMGVTQVLSDGTVEFYTDRFSTFAAFTVDFYYNGMDFSIAGKSSILLSEIFATFGIELDARTAQSVVFSNNELIGVTRQADGDWLLTSLEEFHTEETLIITFADGHTVVIDVTDDSGTVSKDGVTYATLSYSNSIWTGNLDLKVSIYDVSGPNGSSTASAENTFTKVDKRSVPTLSFPERGKWYRIKSTSNLDNISYENNEYEVLLDLNNNNASVVVECIPRTFYQVKDFVTVSQKRYVVIGDSYQTRTVIIKVNGTTKETLPIVFANRDGKAAGQLDVQYIPPASYFYGNYDSLTECGKDKNGYYEDTSGSYYSYSGTTYTVPLYTRYSVTFDGYGNTNTDVTMSSQAFVWGKEQNLKANEYVKVYTVTYDPREGTCSTTSAKAEATFTGWSTTKGGTAVYSDKQAVGKTKGLTDTAKGTVPLYATWKDGYVTLPQPNKLTGYTFKGWYSDTSFAEDKKVGDANATYTPTGNVTLYAKWEANKNKITFDFNNGSGRTATHEATYNSTDFYTVYWLEPAYSGYAFDGWYTADGTQVYGRDGDCLDCAYWKDNRWIGTEDLTLYAHWKPIYQVTLDNEKATTAGTTAYWYIYNTVYDGIYYYTDAACGTPLVNYTITKPTKIGYIFGGYFLGRDGSGTQYINASGVCVGDRYKVAGDVTLHAKWDPIHYTVTYSGNGTYYGSTAVSTHAYDEPKNLTANGFQRSGYTFVGWNTKADGTGDSYADGQSVTNLSDTDGGNVTLYAQWERIYKITLDGQEQSTATPSFYFVYGLDAYYSDSICTAALQGNKCVVPTKAGYTFLGYYINEAGTGDAYVDAQGNISSACCRLEQDTTLYAKWSINTYTITYQYNDGVTADSKQNYNYETNVILPELERDGYEFLGWTNLSKGEAGNNWKWTNYDVGQHPGDEQYGNVILKARWRAITYLIRFDGGVGGVLPEGAQMPDIEATYDGEAVALTANAFRRAVKVTYDVNGGKDLDPADTEVILNASFKHWLSGSNTYADGALVRNLATRQDAVVQLSAQWELAPTRTPAAERDHYTFDGWKVANTTTVYGEDVTIIPAQDITLVAQWDPVEYTVTYDSNGGSAVAPTTYNISQPFALADAPERDGYFFSGWKLKQVPAAAEANWADELYDAGEQLAAGKYGNITLVAQWGEQYRYVLRFDANGGDADSVPATIDSGWIQEDSHTFSWTAVPTRTGYDFVGWAESADSTVNVAGAGKNSITLEGTAQQTEEKLLYAIWERQLGSLKLDLEGSKPAVVTVEGQGLSMTLVLTKDLVLTGLPTGDYTVSATGAAAVSVASVDMATANIKSGMQTVVKVTVSDKDLGWFYAFERVINIFNG